MIKVSRRAFTSWNLSVDFISSYAPSIRSFTDTKMHTSKPRRALELLTLSYETNWLYATFSHERLTLKKKIILHQDLNLQQWKPQRRKMEYNLSLASSQTQVWKLRLMTISTTKYSKTQTISSFSTTMKRVYRKEINQKTRPGITWQNRLTITIQNLNFQSLSGQASFCSTSTLSFWG